MATSIDFIEFVYENVKNFGYSRYKKMFGEYMLYVDEKPILLICDNTVYIKKHEDLSTIMCEADLGFPYNGAKEHYILDIENQSLLNEVIPFLVRMTPYPKKKNK